MGLGSPRSSLMADVATQSRRRYLPAEVRRDGILNAALVELRKKGHLPLSIDRIAAQAGVSKALIYTYFPKPTDLYNGVLEQALAPLRARLAAHSRTPLEEAEVEWAQIYFDRVAEMGNVLHLLFTDPYMKGRLEPGSRRLRDRIFRRLARNGRRLRLTSQESVAALVMILAIPEELGVLAARGDITRARGRELCGSLVRSALSGLSRLKS